MPCCSSLRSHAARLSFFLLFSGGLHIANAQQIPVTYEVVTDGSSPGSTILKDTQTGSAINDLVPGSTDRWKTLNSSTFLNFGDDFDFHLSEPSTPSTSGLLELDNTLFPNNGQSYTQTFSNNGNNWGAWTHKYFEQCITDDDYVDDDDADDCAAVFGCDCYAYEDVTASANATFDNGLAGDSWTYTIIDNNGVDQIEPLAYSNSISDLEFTRIMLVGSGDKLYFQFGNTKVYRLDESLENGYYYYQCDNNPTACPSSCNNLSLYSPSLSDAAELDDISIHARNFEEDSESDSGSIFDPCEANAYVEAECSATGYIKYKRTSTQGRAWAGLNVQSNFWGTLGYGCQIDNVRCKFSGSHATDCEVWLESPSGTRFRLWNNESDPGSTHDLSFSNLTGHFLNENPAGLWKCILIDNRNQDQHTLNDFEMTLTKSPQITWAGALSCADNNGIQQEIGDAVYLENFIIEHNLSNDANFILTNISNNKTEAFGYLASGSAVDLNNHVDFEGTNTSDQWRIEATSTNFYADQDNTITNVTLNFSGKPSPNACASSGSADRISSGRAWMTHFSPDCTNPDNHIFYQNSGNQNPSADHRRIVNRIPNNVALESGSPGIRYVMLEQGVYDGYDLANDLHYTAVLLNNNEATGKRIYRPQVESQSMLSPLLEVTQSQFAPQSLIDETCFNIHITTDNWPAETSWGLKQNGIAVASGAPTIANTTVTHSMCLEPGTYVLEVNDSYGDGILGDNNVHITNQDGVLLLPESDVSGNGASFTFTLEVNSSNESVGLVPHSNGLKEVIMHANSAGYTNPSHAESSSTAMFHLMSNSIVHDIYEQSVDPSFHLSDNTPPFPLYPESWHDWMALIPDNLPDASPFNPVQNGEDWSQIKGYDLASENNWDVTPSWSLGDVNLSSILDLDLNNTSITNPTTRTASLLPNSVNIEQLRIDSDDHDMWSSNADVQLFTTSELVTWFEEGNTFEESILHVSLPITAPVYDVDEEETIPLTGADAINKQAPYWGFPNGVSGHAEMFVRITSRTNPSVYHETTINSFDQPLMRKDCPFLVQDSLRLEVPVSELNGFFGGDEVDIQCMGLWTTDARRTALWADSEADHRLILCASFNEAFAITSADTTKSSDGLKTEATLHWNTDTASAASGGYMRVQRRQAGSNDPWKYFSIANTDVLSSLNLADFQDSLELYNAAFLTTDRSEAHIWRNSDEDLDGSPDMISFSDPTLLTSAWQCKQAEYRIEQEMCAGETFYTAPFPINILGDIENPWKIDGELSQGITTSHGDFPFKVRIDWSTATDQNDLIDQFRVYRRPYEPANPNELAWQQIFSSEDFTWFIDQDISAGVLYEYKVGAIVNCATESQETTAITEFFPPEPYNIGFRSASGGVSGEVLYEDGAASGGTKIEVLPQGEVGARNSIELDHQEYIKLDLNNLTDESATNWPDINSHIPGAEWSLSQWVQIPTESASSISEEEADAGLPLMAFNFTDPATQIVNEAFSIRAASAPSGQMELQLLQAGVPTPLGVFLDAGMFNHLIVTVINDPSDPESNSPGLVVQVTCAEDQWDILPSTGSAMLILQPNEVNEVRENWTSIYWNAASYASPSCSDPFGDNFAPLATSAQQSSCDYDTNNPGCSDPDVNQLTGSNQATFDVHLAEDDACDYGVLSTGKALSIRWFSDDSQSANEAPAIYALNGEVETLIQNFHEDLMAVETAAGSGYAYSMPVLHTKLPEGSYRVRVHNNITNQSGTTELLNATNFSGNFSVHDDLGTEYVNCIQYLESEVENGEYDFVIDASGCLLPTSTPQVADYGNLITDCAECYSISFTADSDPYVLSSSADGSNYLSNTSSVAFWFRAPHHPGQIFALNEDELVFSAIEDEASDNTQGIAFEVVGTETLSRITEKSWNEYNLVPGQWYHASLSIGLGSGSFTLRSTNLNDNDFEPWNSTREFIFTDDDVNAPYLNPNGITFSSLAFGGTDCAIHQVSVWNASLSKEQSLVAFNGVNTSSGLFSDSESLFSQHLVSVLTPDNSGRFIDHMTGMQIHGSDNTSISLGATLFSQTFDQGDETSPLIGTSIGSTDPMSRSSVRRAPYGACNPGCARVYNACNYNPLANVHQDCELNCAGVTTAANRITAYPVNYDEIRGWTGAPYDALQEDARIAQADHPLYQVPYTSVEMAHFWSQRYPAFLTEGLFLMYDADEGLGNVLYDRAQFGADGWSHNSAKFQRQTTQISSDGSEVLYFNGPAPDHLNYYSSSTPKNTPETLGNWTLSSEINGNYMIGNVKYKGTGNIFDIIPKKTTDGNEHLFTPAQQVALVGDMMLVSENKDFTDVSAFQVDLQVNYQDIQAGEKDYSGEGTTVAGDCPVQGVRFMVNEVIAKDSTDNPIETDRLGRATLYLPKGTVNIEPILIHLDDQGSEDDHVFTNTGLPMSLDVTGPRLHAAGNSVPFTDVTQRQIVGRIIGGDHQAYLPWGSSTNNLGKATFLLVKENGVEGSSAFEISTGCPAVEVETDLTGQYSAQVLPGLYRVAVPHDAANHPGLFGHNPYSDFNITGWAGNTTPSFIDEFAHLIKDDGNGGFNINDPEYTQWSTLEKSVWNQDATYPGYPAVSQDLALPVDAYDRIDFVYQPTPVVSVEQTQPKTSEPGCESTRLSALPSSLGEIFIGTAAIEVAYDGQDYVSPSAYYLESYRRGVEDPGVDAYDGTPPFPMGLPVLNSGNTYCASIKAKMQFSTAFGGHEFSDEAEVFGNGYQVAIQNTLSNPQDFPFIPLDAAGGAPYSFQAAAPSYDPTNLVPRGFLSVKLYKGNQHISSWQPFSTIIDTGIDTGTIPGIFKNPDGTTAFDHNKFDAILFGGFVSAPSVPVSAEPTLEFILRDPPGDNSFCSIDQGSVLSYAKSVSTQASDSKSRTQNLEYLPEFVFDGGTTLAPLGIGLSLGSEATIDPVANVTHEETYEFNKAGGVNQTEQFTFNETVTTSAEEQSMDYGINQDLFYGAVTNTSMGITKNFGPSPASVAISAASASNMANSLGLPLSGTSSEFILDDANGDGYIDSYPFFEANEDGSVKLTGNNATIQEFSLGWSESIKKSLLPASYFMKTQYTIESVDIPMLESARKAYFHKYPQWYSWPDGTSADVAYEDLDWTYPEGMQLANNDDHRWELFHQNWMANMKSDHPDFPTEASTISKGYQIPDPTGAVNDWATDLSATITADLAGSGVSETLVSRLSADLESGDDRLGAGYIFSVPEEDLNGQDPRNLDSVRYYNIQIASWKQMLAENELEKLSFRRKIFGDLQEDPNNSPYADPNQLTTWIDNLNATGAIANDWSLEDFADITDDDGNPINTNLSADLSLWNEADFTPFFLSFSGGGATYAQSLTKTNIQEVTRSRELSASWDDTFQAGILVNGAGITSDVRDQNTITETRANSESTETSINYSFTLSDNEESDFYLVAVAPGRGLNGPLFLNLGGVASCPTVPEEPSKYREWYPSLIPSDINVTADIDQCGSTATPQWSRTIDPTQFALDPATSDAWPVIDNLVIGNENLSTTVGSDVAVMTTSALIGGGLTIAAVGAAASGNLPGSVAIGVAAGVAVGFAFGDLAANIIWRQGVESDFENQFGEMSYFEGSEPLVGFEETPGVWIHPDYCAEMTASINEDNKNYIVQPAPVELEVPEVTLTYTLSDGTVLSGMTEVNPPISAPMDEPIGLTMNVRNNAPDPYGGAQDFVFYSDALANTIGANAYIGGSNATSVEYEIAPAWQVGGYDIPVSIHHSGVESAEFMSGSVKLTMLSVCDWNIESSAVVNINFEPACSDVNLTAPLDQWTANLDQIASGSYFSNTGDLELAVDIARNDFTNWVNDEDGEPVLVQYKTATGTQWTTISGGVQDNATDPNTGQVSDFEFLWKPLDANDVCNPYGGECLGFEGDIQLRAVTQCASTFAVPQYSDVVTGHVDFVRPELFGEVLPTDGFYGLGDEIMLRWSEEMETFDPLMALNPDSIQIRAIQNNNHVLNSGGLQFSGNEFAAIPNGFSLDASGWLASVNLWVDASDSPASNSISDGGVIFCQGDDALGSISVKFTDNTHIAVEYRGAGNVVLDADTLEVLPIFGGDWENEWINLDVRLEHGTATDYTITLDLSGYEVFGSINMPNFNLPTRRLTLGNGWQNGQANGQACPLPMQEFRLWNSQRETQLANVSAFLIRGDELGLQLYLPMNELEGAPQDRARGRNVIMEANWYAAHDASALDFIANSETPGAIQPSMSGFGLTTLGSRSTTVEVWVKPGGADETFLCINGNPDPSIDSEMTGWTLGTDANHKLIASNGGINLSSASSLSDAWHHIALVRHHNGSVNLYLDGLPVDASPSYSHGSLVPQVILLGHRPLSGGEADQFFTGKLDELRVWSTALPANTLAGQMRDGVYGYDNLVLHAPFEARGSAGNSIENTEAYTYSLWDGYDYFNDASSLSMPSTWAPIEITNNGSGGDLSMAIQSEDAPLMQAEPQASLGWLGDVNNVSWNAGHDEVILSLNQNRLYAYEDQLVTFTIPKEQLRDAAGNSISNDLTFDLLIDRNPLKWGDEFMSFEGHPEQDVVLSTTVENHSNSPKYFEIVGLPVWIEAIPSSGMVSANGAIEVNFSSTQPLAIGQYMVDAKLKGGLPCGSNSSSGFCYAERMTMDLDIYVDAPEVSFESSSYDFVMPIISKVIIDNVISGDERDLVLTFIDGELRGYSHLDMLVSDQQLAFINVFFNDEDYGKPVTFNIWDASEDIIKALAEPFWPSLNEPVLALSPNENGIGSLFEPLLLKATNRVMVNTTLQTGWNWVSVNVTQEDEFTVRDAFNSIPNEAIIQVKSHLEGVHALEGQWTPLGENNLDVNTRYSVKMQGGPDDVWLLSNIGQEAQVAEHPHPLVSGWNELGYVPQQSLPIELALQSLADADTILSIDDMVKSRNNGFAVYAGNGDWVGPLEMMRPGHGYRVRLGNLENAGVALGTLEWPELSSSWMPEFRSAGPTSDGWVNTDEISQHDGVAWSMDVREMEHSMSMIARLELPNSMPQSLDDVLGAFQTDELGNENCVGQILPRDTDQGLLYFISIFGDAGTNGDLTFRWKSGVSGSEFAADEVLLFDAGALKGTPSAPIKLSFHQSGMELTQVDGGLVAYPNPFNRELTIHWHGEQPVLSLLIEDANGRLLEVLDCDHLTNGPCRWASSSLESGVYFIRAITERGQRIVRIMKQ